MPLREGQVVDRVGFRTASIASDLLSGISSAASRSSISLPQLLTFTAIWGNGAQGPWWCAVSSGRQALHIAGKEHHIAHVLRPDELAHQSLHAEGEPTVRRHAVLECL